MMTIDCSGCLNGKTQKAKKKSVKTIKIKTSSPVLAKKTNQKNQFKSFFNANDQLKMSAKTTANKKNPKIYACLFYAKRLSRFCS